MQSETKTCQNCKNKFVIEPEDFEFYQKIKVPPPTWCPECRMVRRMVFRNERSLFKRKCDLCEVSVIAMYRNNTPFPVYCNNCWWSDNWNPIIYGKDYDFSIPFFAQFSNLIHTVPRMALETYQSTSSPFSNFTWFSRNVYMSSSTLYSENIFNSPTSWKSREIFDSYQVYNSERCYETVNSHQCANTRYVVKSKDCTDSSFLHDCRNCTNCFMSSNLRNKSFVYRNQQLSREKYLEILTKINMGSVSVVNKLKEEFTELQIKSLNKFSNLINTINSTGDNLNNAKNSHFCFNGEEIDNIKYVAQVVKVKDSFDLYGSGNDAELLYEGVNVGYKDSNVFFSSNTFESCRNVWYADYCRQLCENIFGCVGLRQKQYCILNRQYSKEEYEKIVPKIIDHMSTMPYIDGKGNIYKYGEFFPPELSPFAYNETIAQEYYPTNKQIAIDSGYLWKDRNMMDYQITLKTSDIPDDILEVKDSILNQVIACAHGGDCLDQCTAAFKITPEELAFYKATKIALPNLCLNCRYATRLEYRNPLKLWHRQCQCAGTKSSNGVYQNQSSHSHGSNLCPNEFETSYAPERPEIVYCENCYNNEIA